MLLIVIGLAVGGVIAAYYYTKNLKNKRFDAEAKAEYYNNVKRQDESRKELKRLEEEINAFEVNKADFYKRYDKYIKRKRPDTTSSRD